MIFFNKKKPAYGEHMMHEDKYKSYNELSQNEVEGKDFEIVCPPIAGNSVAILAPHGGKIEFFTAELAKYIAGNEHNYYAFKGLKKNGNRDLHITSHRFDEPRALKLIADCEKVITIHGLSGNEESLQVGGRDDELRKRIYTALINAGFNSEVVTQGKYSGMCRENICNRGVTKTGVQLEIKAGLRKILKKDDTKCKNFVAAIRSALL